MYQKCTILILPPTSKYQSSKTSDEDESVKTELALQPLQFIFQLLTDLPGVPSGPGSPTSPSGPELPSGPRGPLAPLGPGSPCDRDKAIQILLLYS
jgi:hypothetical protein